VAISALLLVSCSKDDDGGTRPPLRSSAPHADSLSVSVQGGDDWQDTNIKLGEADESEVY
jgi:hypothetical protein